MQKIKYIAFTIILSIVFFICVPVIDDGFPTVKSGVFGYDSVSAVKYAETKTKRFKININTASEEELTILDGIGEKTARAIVEYRKTHGVFKTIDELDNVKGISKNKIDKIRDNISIQ